MQSHCKKTHDQAYVGQAYKKTTVKRRYKSDVISWCDPLENNATAISEN